MRKGRNYYVYKSEGKRAVSQREWAACVNSPLRYSDHKCSSCCGERELLSPLLAAAFSISFSDVGRGNAGPLRNSTSSL